MPEAASVKKGGIPFVIIFFTQGLSNPKFRKEFFEKWNLFFFLKKQGYNTIILMTGDNPVANAAPKIPIRNGKIKI